MEEDKPVFFLLEFGICDECGIPGRELVWDWTYVDVDVDDAGGKRVLYDDEFLLLFPSSAAIAAAAADDDRFEVEDRDGLFSLEAFAEVELSSS